MLKYKLVKKVNPLKRTEPAKWYAIPVTGEPQTTKAMTRAATENTTTAPVEMESAIDLFGRYAIKQLQAGNSVRLGELGTLRFTFKSKGVDTLEKYNPVQNIKEVRVIFTPSKDFREQVLQGVEFSEAGVLDEDISYASLDDYHRAQGTNPGGGEEEGGSSSGGNGEGTLG